MEVERSYMAAHMVRIRKPNEFKMIKYLQTSTTTPVTRAIPSRTTKANTAVGPRQTAARIDAATSLNGISRWTAVLRRRGRSVNIMLARITLKVSTFCQFFSSVDFPFLQWAAWNITLPILWMTLKRQGQDSTSTLAGRNVLRTGTAKFLYGGVGSQVNVNWNITLPILWTTLTQG